jgi:phosphohistidine phosphatase SixA
VTAGFGAEEVVVERLYLAGVNALLDCLQATPAEVNAVAIVAHNPGLTYLTNALGAEDVTDNLVTFGCARFEYSGEWSDLALGQAQFQALDTPKTIR